MKYYVNKFPAPLEDWVVSYSYLCWIEELYLFCFRPLSRYRWFSTGMVEQYRLMLQCFRPLARVGWGPTVELLRELEAWGIVSVPSRGLGGFLRLKKPALAGCLIDFRPLSRYEWFPTESPKVEIPEFQGFPSPLEGWVVSYQVSIIGKVYNGKSFRPLSRVGWFPTHILYP